MASTKIPLELTAYAPDADGATLELQTTDTTVTDGSVLGKIEFKAPKEASGTDAILVGAAIEAVAEGTFAADNNATELVFKTGASEAATQKMVLTSEGNLGIGTTAATGVRLDIRNDSTTTLADFRNANSSGYGLYVAGGSSSSQYALRAADKDNNALFSVMSNGKVGLGTTSPAKLLTLAESADGTKLRLNRGGVSEWDFSIGNSSTLSGVGSGALEILAMNGGTAQELAIGSGAGGVAPYVHVTASGVTFSGSLSKGSGSFKIDHPLESKKDTHHLVHSFVEAPQADNIYRGKVALSNGTATVNIDTEVGMTEGTFVALNTDVQCFTTNETDWDAVKGSLSGNILTITCQNSSSTATISWLVIGERQDQHIKDTDWTDANGKVILEPLKAEES